MNPLHTVKECSIDGARRHPVFWVSFLIVASIVSVCPQASTTAETQAPAASAKPAFQLLLAAGAAVPSAGPVVAPQPGKTGAVASAFHARPGPWGKLRCNYIFIEAPKSLVDTYPLPGTQTRWSFPESMVDSLPGLFKKAGLPDTFIAALLSSPNNRRVDGMIHFFPAAKDVEAMTPAMREALYPELRKHPVNEYYFSPVKVTAGSTDEWFRTSKLRPELLAKIRQVAYRYDNCLAISDLALLFHHATSEAEARNLLKVLTRTRSVMIQLELPEGTNLEPLLEYWTVGINSRRKDIEPILQSILDAGGTEVLGLSQILPALPRKLLYTYPGPEFIIHGMLPDCHWTSLNFFNYDPHQFYLDERIAAEVLMETHSAVEPPHRYGDVLVFYEEESGRIMHSCVYLADDFVFTKNGRNAFSPWIIMTIDELSRLYFHGATTSIQGYRHKKSPK